MIRTFHWTVLIALLLSLPLAGCTEKSPAPKQGAAERTGGGAAGTIPDTMVKQIIERYNQLLIGGYMSMNMTPIQEVASEDVAMKAYYHMAALGEGNNRLVSQLKKIDFKEIASPAAGTYQATTREVWDFVHVNIKTGATSNEQKNYVYDVVYTLENKKGRWVLTSISAIGEERDKGKAPKRNARGGPAAHQGMSR